MGFHSGELAVQDRAGVRAYAQRLASMAARGRLSAGTAALLSSARLAVVTARDGDGRLWTSPLVGQPGFLAAAAPTTLRIQGGVADVDPLHGMLAGQPVGVVAIDFAARRRLRVNGVLTHADSAGLVLEVDQAYGNCPKYIEPRLPAMPAGSAAAVFDGSALRPAERVLIEGADTFFLGTAHPTSGNDASHRGGPAGFVRVDDGRLSWPDYPGNNLFNSLGNIAVDPATALLFLDFVTGAAVQLSGTAALEWSVSDVQEAERSVVFTPERVLTTTNRIRVTAS
ncbi:pyridoxamine 5'-phosphate oxidase [Mycolicibacterium litorale]|nr:pyridoxamine 5'-phosphate oxidase [Mycolicibacterium litorale]